MRRKPPVHIPTRAAGHSYARRMKRGFLSFGPLMVEYRTPADGDGPSDILSATLDEGDDPETALCDSIASVLETVDSDWTALIHAKLNT